MKAQGVLRWIVVSPLLALLPWSGAGAGEPPPLPTPAAAHAPTVGHSAGHDVSPALRDVPAIPPAPGPHVREILRRPRIPRGGRHMPARDPVLQQFSGTVSMPATSQSFEGSGNVDGVLPPDTNGAVGPAHYVQWVNLSFAIYNKSGGLVYGPAAGNTLWSGFGGPCQTQNDGDPVVLYDKLAGRWVMSQLALPNFPDGPFYQCFAVSQTSDPTGAFYRYAFVTSNTLLNDYPKVGVWPDGYYLAVNQFHCYDIIPPFGFIACDFAGQGAFAFERDKMLGGLPARMVGFTLPTSNLAGMLPSDADGSTPPPGGAPNYFVQVDENVWFSPPLPSDRLQIWPFHVDWTTPANSTFGPNGPGSDLGIVLPVADFDSNMCDYQSNCVPQPGFDILNDPAPGLDALADRLMYRLQYRNFGTYQVLIANHTVKVGTDNLGNDRAGIRWYELRDTGSGWFVHQQGTYAPSDGVHRWMGSMAMDGAGNLALGFSLASRSPEVYPSIAWVGRQASDSNLGVMTEAETVIVSGSGAQLHSSGRWGDYSLMAVDPTDDCTFWYTTEYYSSTDVIVGVNWQTRIAAFKFPSCGAGADDPPSAAGTNPANGATVSGTTTITADAADDHGVTRVEFYVDGTSIGLDTDGSNGWSAAWNTTTVTNGAHTLTARATDSVGQTTTSSPISVTVANPSTTSMGVFQISWQSGKNLTVTVNIRRDSNASGALTSGDAPVSGAAVTFVLKRDSNASGSFETCQSAGGPDQCWTFSGTTNSKGDFRAKLVNAPAGAYQAKVTSLARSPYLWTPTLDLDNPDIFTK